MDTYEKKHTAYPFPSWRRKPCERIEGYFVWGPQSCSVLTRRRVWLPSISRGAHAADCGDHR